MSRPEFFKISLAAQLAGMHAQTLRTYDRRTSFVASVYGPLEFGCVGVPGTRKGRHRRIPMSASRIRLHRQSRALDPHPEQGQAERRDQQDGQGPCQHRKAVWRSGRGHQRSGGGTDVEAEHGDR